MDISLKSSQLALLVCFIIEDTFYRNHTFIAFTFKGVGSQIIIVGAPECTSFIFFIFFIWIPLQNITLRHSTAPNFSLYRHHSHSFIV